MVRKGSIGLMLVLLAAAPVLRMLYGPGAVRLLCLVLTASVGVCFLGIVAIIRDEEDCHDGGP